MPCRERLRGSVPFSEQCGPVTLLPPALLLPQLAQLRVWARRGQLSNQHSRHRLVEQTIGLRTVVTRDRQHADLVLYLNHQHRVAIRIECLEMIQQSDERATVSIQCRG